MKDNTLAFSFFCLSSFWEKPQEYIHSWTTGPENSFFPQAIMLLNCLTHLTPPIPHAYVSYVIDIKNYTEEFLSGVLYILGAFILISLF